MIDMTAPAPASLLECTARNVGDGDLAKHISSLPGGAGLHRLLFVEPKRSFIGSQRMAGDFGLVRWPGRWLGLTTATAQCYSTVLWCSRSPISSARSPDLIGAVARPQHFGSGAPDPIRRSMRQLSYRTLTPCDRLVPCFVRAARNVS